MRATEYLRASLRRTRFSRTFLQPVVSLLRLFLAPRILLASILQQACVLGESGTLRRRERCGEQSRVLLVYDCLVSPPNYGTVLYMVMLGRYFSVHGERVCFLIVDSGRRSDWALLDEMESRTLIEDFVNLTSNLAIVGTCSEARRVTWPECLQALNEATNETDVYVPFGRRVLERKAIYHLPFRLTNQLLAHSPQGFRDRFLITNEEMKKRTLTLYPAGRYITWHIRHSTKWRPVSNLPVDEFLSTYRDLSDRFPEHSIVVISDEVGCTHYRQIAEAYSLSLLFCKDYSQSFLGDCALIVGGDYYFALRGGGITAVALFSRVSYGVISAVSHVEGMWSDGQITSWASSEQVWKRDTKGSPHDVVTRA
jgi:hypothetical protein